MKCKEVVKELQTLADNLKLIPSTPIAQAIEKAIEVCNDYAKQEEYDEYIGDNL